MRIAIASDHAGFELKERIARALVDEGHSVDNLGPTSADRVDYPDFALKVAGAVKSKAAERGILVCGSGIGMEMTANRVSGVRAANCVIEYQAEMCRRHNDANVLCLGERVLGPDMVTRLVKIFLDTPFDGGRHEGRVQKINAAS